MPFTLREVLQRLQAAVAGIGPPLDGNPFSGSVRISCPREGGFTVLIDTRDAPKSIADALQDANNNHSVSSNNNSQQQQLSEKTTVSTSSSAVGQQKQPACVVCLDTAEELSRSECRLVSGKCGHLHCTQCALRLRQGFANRCSVCRNSLGTPTPLFW